MREPSRWEVGPCLLRIDLPSVGCWRLTLDYFGAIIVICECKTYDLDQPAAKLPANYALERSVRGLSERAAGAQTIITPAARWQRLARPAQRGGYASL